VLGVIFRPRFGRRLIAPKLVLFLKLHEGIVITFPELFHFTGECIVCLKHNIIVFSIVLIMFSLRQKHTPVFFIATMLLVLKHLIKILVYVIILERRSRFLVALFSLLPLSDLRDLTPSEVLIFGLGVMLFLGSRFVSHGHSFH
jgi:hypothetical protein